MFPVAARSGRADLLLVSAFVLGVGALGSNGVTYLVGGELAAGSDAGRALSLIATVFFVLGSAASIPLGVLGERLGLPLVFAVCALSSAGGVIVARSLPRQTAEPGWRA